MTVKQIRPTAQPEVIAILEKALAKAEKGNLQDICLIGSVPGGEVYSNFSTENIPDLIGQLEFLKFTMLERMSENGR